MAKQLVLEKVNVDKLTERQLVVFRALEKGKNANQIARQMKISAAGVYGHIRAIKETQSPTNGKANGRTKAAGKRGRDSAIVLTPTNTGDNGGGNSAPRERVDYDAIVRNLADALATEKEQAASVADQVAQLKQEAADAADHLNRHKARIEALTNAGKSLDPALA